MCDEKCDQHHNLLLFTTVTIGNDYLYLAF